MQGEPAVGGTAVGFDSHYTLVGNDCCGSVHSAEADNMVKTADTAQVEDKARVVDIEDAVDEAVDEQIVEAPDSAMAVDEVEVAAATGSPLH